MKLVLATFVKLLNRWLTLGLLLALIFLCASFVPAVFRSPFEVDVGGFHLSPFEALGLLLAARRAAPADSRPPALPLSHADQSPDALLRGCSRRWPASWPAISIAAPPRRGVLHGLGIPALLPRGQRRHEPPASRAGRRASWRSRRSRWRWSASCSSCWRRMRPRRGRDHRQRTASAGIDARQPGRAGDVPGARHARSSSSSSCAPSVARNATSGSSASTLVLVAVLLTQTRTGLLALWLTGAVFAWRVSRRAFRLALASALGLLSDPGDHRRAAPLAGGPRRRVDPRGWRSPRRRSAEVASAPWPDRHRSRQGRGHAWSRSAAGRTVSQRVHNENMHLTLLLRTGLIGWALIMWVIGAALAGIYRGSRAVSDRRLALTLWAIFSSGRRLPASRWGTSTPSTIRPSRSCSGASSASASRSPRISTAPADLQRDLPVRTGRLTVPTHPNGTPPRESESAHGLGRVTSMARWLARRRQPASAGTAPVGGDAGLQRRGDAPGVPGAGVPVDLARLRDGARRRRVDRSLARDRRPLPDPGRARRRAGSVPPRRAIWARRWPTGEFLFFVDSDVMVRPDTLRVLAERFEPGRASTGSDRRPGRRDAPPQPGQPVQEPVDALDLSARSAGTSRSSTRRPPPSGGRPSSGRGLRLGYAHAQRRGHGLRPEASRDSASGSGPPDLEVEHVKRYSLCEHAADRLHARGVA